MKATVSWSGGLAFVGAAKSGIPVQMDADASLGGSNRGVQPMEMIAMGLAACMAMDVLSIMQKKRQQITIFDVTIDAPRSSEYPKVFKSAEIAFVIAGRNVDESALRRSIELSATKYCAAHAMLEKVFPISLCYEIYEEEETGSRQLIYQGTWQADLPG